MRIQLRVVCLLSGVIMFAVLGCHRQTNMAAVFPATDQVPGWSRVSDVRTFAAADLYKYIDGEAERYLKAGVQRASTADYRFQGKLDAVVDIYTMSSADGATEIMDQEPPAGASMVGLGDSARLFRQSLIFRKGPQLVRIVTYQQAPEGQEALLALGAAIEKKL